MLPNMFNNEIKQYLKRIDSNIRENKKQISNVTQHFKVSLIKVEIWKLKIFYLQTFS